MSLPQLQTSPTVELKVNTARQLEARVIRSVPNVNNALRVNPAGLYVKRGIRKNGWNIQRAATSAIANVAQANQMLIWATEQLDPDGLVDLVAQPTRVTAIEAGYYWNRSYLQLQPVGASTAAAAAASGELLTLVNGSKWVAGNEVYAYAPIGSNVIIEADCSGYVYLNAGDYMELAWRFVVLESITATSWTWIGSWAGGRIAP